MFDCPANNVILKADGCLDPGVGLMSCWHNTARKCATCCSTFKYPHWLLVPSLS